MLAVIMAGGEGTRLLPLTETIPKPMLNLGHKPILEIVVRQLKNEGFSDLVITTGYKGRVIKEYFNNGSKFKVNIQYTIEKKKLGTVGALSLIKKKILSPFLVVNGDILTQESFASIIKYHNKNNADLTLGIVKYGFDIPYGVVNKKGNILEDIDEKPRLLFEIGAGIYVFSPDVLKYIPYNQYLDLNEFLKILKNKEHSIVCYNVTKYWKDIGIKKDYDDAQRDVKSWTMSQLYHLAGETD